MMKIVKGVSLRNTARHIRKYGAPEIEIKSPMMYRNRWRSEL